MRHLSIMAPVFWLEEEATSPGDRAAERRTV